MLPEAFTKRMKTLLAEEYGAFLDSFSRPRAVALRLNPLKTQAPPDLSGFSLRPVPWEPCGFYYDPETRPGKSAYHEAGLYYLQEASAMAPAALLDPQPGERVLDLFEKTTGGRVILSVVKVGGVVRDIDANQMAEIVSVLDGIKDEYTQIMNTLLTDTSVKNRTVGVGHITTEDAAALSMVGPFARASNLPYDVRSFGRGAYGDLADFAPITATEGDCYARVKVRCLEVLQSIEIIKELGAKIPAGDIEVAVKGAPADGAQASNVLEQPRGECYYYARGNGSKNLERMRMRTPTSQNLAGMTVALKGCDLADVNMIILTIDPCISCTER